MKKCPNCNGTGNVPDNVIGDSVIRYRKERGLTQQGLSERCGLSRALIASIESGRTEGSVKALRAIANGFGITVQSLFEDNSDG